MIHLALPDSSPRRLAFYLAMEEWAASHLPPDEYFFAWRVSPTVICGRNQDIEKEVNLQYCKDNGIDVVRRKSGGGCVYADLENWMFSYVTPSEEVTSTFSRYTVMIAGMLASLGFDAVATGRNDLLIGDRKVAGNAFYHKPGRSIVHGTMLIKIDHERMNNAITPSRAKLESKAVRSVESRITCLADEGLDMSTDEFGVYAIDFLTDSTLHLSSEQVAEISEIEQSYYSKSHIAGRSVHDRMVKADTDYIKRYKRFDGVGEMEAIIQINCYKQIQSISITGDFFVLANMETRLSAPLVGIIYSRDSIEKVLKDIRCEEVIKGLQQEQLLSLLI